MTKKIYAVNMFKNFELCRYSLYDSLENAIDYLQLCKENAHPQKTIESDKFNFSYVDKFDVIVTICIRDAIIH